eukprot:1359459-Amorphochlora_amoeboformis.AAC.2
MATGAMHAVISLAFLLLDSSARSHRVIQKDSQRRPYVTRNRASARLSRNFFRLPKPKAMETTPIPRSRKTYPAGVYEGSHRWESQGLDVHYLAADGPKTKGEATKTPLLFLPGFGVGSFQYIESVKRASRGRNSYALDWVGQGRSWPSDPTGFQLSADFWVEQAAAFITDVIGGPTYIAGNSLGGFLAAQLAARHPELVKGVILLNATPFWAIRPPKAKSSTGPWSNVWDGVLPAPSSYKSLSSFFFNALRQEDIIKSILEMVYVDKTQAAQELVREILDSAAHPIGEDAYASIAFSPRASLPFADALKAGSRAG